MELSFTISSLILIAKNKALNETKHAHIRHNRMKSQNKRKELLWTSKVRVSRDWVELEFSGISIFPNVSINREPNSTLNFRLSEHTWTWCKPDIHHIRMFGCSPFVHITEEKT